MRVVTLRRSFAMRLYARLPRSPDAVSRVTPDDRRSLGSGERSYSQAFIDSGPGQCVDTRRTRVRRTSFAHSNVYTDSTERWLLVGYLPHGCAYY